MKALTIRQPHASLIALGVKTIETRSWSTRYRGPIAIHAGAHRPPSYGHGIGGSDYRIRGYGRTGLALTGPGLPKFRHAPKLEGYLLPLGAIVATAVLTDCVPMVPPPGQVRPEFEPHRDRHRLFVAADSLWLTNPRGYGPPVDVSDQLPFGDFAPGRYAWLLDDVKPTTERCPGCWGKGHPVHCWALTCTTCRGHQSCEPVPAKGRRGLWTWTPEGMS